MKPALLLLLLPASASDRYVETQQAIARTTFKVIALDYCERKQ